MEDKTAKKALKLIELSENKICNHCLGRKFSKLIDGNDNEDRGIIIRKNLNLDQPTSEDICPICGNLFDKINESLYERIDQKINYIGLEFDNFLVGTRLEKELLKNDEKMSEYINVDCENIKKEINRIVGLALEKRYKKDVEFDNNNILIELNFKKEEPTVYIKINPIFIEGRYNKLVRGIPQTKWPCRECHGKGCEYCNYTGKLYPESVEEILSDIVLKYSKGRSCKFHGAGREDIDVLMLGDGRPFVLEVIEPKIRNLDLKDIEKEANVYANGKTKYNNLKFCKRNRKAEIKVSSPDTYKVYEALVKSKDDIKKEDLDILKTLNLIKQQTPLRVKRRRADMIREKRVIDLETEFIDSNTFKMKIKTEGGLYIKELISSDEGRSNPSVTNLLNTECICEKLDVLEVSKK